MWKCCIHSTDILVGEEPNICRQIYLTCFSGNMPFSGILLTALEVPAIFISTSGRLLLTSLANSQLIEETEASEFTVSLNKPDPRRLLPGYVVK